MYSNSREDDHMPFFPKYESKLLSAGALRVTWFEVEFSQCRYYFDGPTSNACTLIAILVAAKCYANQIEIDPNKEITKDLIVTLATSIIDGNNIHNILRNGGKLTDLNLTVPDALRLAGKRAQGLVEWNSALYLGSLEDSLYKNMKSNMRVWNEFANAANLKSDLFIPLICNCRTVMFIWQRKYDSISLVDSHPHGKDRGAVIATASKSEMKALCLWFARLIKRCYQATPAMYELSFLHIKNERLKKKMTLSRRFWVDEIINHFKSAIK